MPISPVERLLPAIGRLEVLAVCAEVDALLDRHPRAELSRQVRAGVEALLVRAAEGRRVEPRAASVAALIVCAQRPEWIEHALRITGGPARPAKPSEALLDLVATAAASSPATERVPVLVLLADLKWAAGRRDEAERLTEWATRSDPHDLGARLLTAALRRTQQHPGRSTVVRAA